MTKQPIIAIAGDKSLELIMRDVMDRLADSASQLAYSASEFAFEILSLEPPRAVILQDRTNKVVAVATARSHDIVDFLIRREKNLEY